MAPGEAMAALFCRRCRIFDCLTHPNEQAPTCATLPTTNNVASPC